MDESNIDIKNELYEIIKIFNYSDSFKVKIRDIDPKKYIISEGLGISFLAYYIHRSRVNSRLGEEMNRKEHNFDSLYKYKEYNDELKIQLEKLGRLLNKEKNKLYICPNKYKIRGKYVFPILDDEDLKILNDNEYLEKYDVENSYSNINRKNYVEHEHRKKDVYCVEHEMMHPFANINNILRSSHIGTDKNDKFIVIVKDTDLGLSEEAIMGFQYIEIIKPPEMKFFY